MIRYLLFGGSRYYPHGGWDDLRGSFDTLEEARTASRKYLGAGEYSSDDWTQIVDIDTGKVVT